MATSSQFPDVLSEDGRLAWSDADIAASIPARFERVVAAFPEHEAVRSGTRSLSYQQLNRAANRLARAIQQQLGTRGGEPVGIVLGHDIPAIVAIVGVLKSGNIYVPLDPAQPLARAAAIAADAGTRLLIGGGAALERARALAASEGAVIDIDALDATLSDTDLDHAVGPDALLNIMYTSGSTGTPKGVLQTHGNLLHEMRANVEQFGLGPRDRVTLLLSIGFGASAADIASALLNGAALLLFDLKREGLAALGPWLRRERVTLYHSVPTVFRHLLSTLAPDEVLPDMRYILLGGESVLAQDVALFRRHFDDQCVLRVGLGSTEAYLATRFLVSKDSEVGDGVVPIGVPNKGKRVLLLDQAGEPVADGEPGEIVIVSRWLSPGYWRRPEQSAATFQPVPGGDERAYHTGDLGRRLPDGNLQHLGRKDFQVKIRGHRVEIGEIETRLMELPALREAAVVARVDHLGEQRLVAYVVPQAGEAPSAAELRAALARSLPDWMLPSAWVSMERLPLLPFGKVDRMALPAPQWGRPSSSAAYEPPSTPLEKLLAGIWTELLGVERAGIHDDFLELGGNSLLAAQVVTRVADATGVELAASALFDAPTIAALALLVARHAASDEGDLAALLDELDDLTDEQARARLDDAGG